MFETLAIINRRLIALISLTVLTACGGGGSSPSVSDQQSLAPANDSVFEITGAGIKGPLAYAKVSIFALDTNFEKLYDSDKPVATATTNAYADIQGLSVSRTAPPDSAPPYVLVIDGTNAVDLNTNTAPVISELVTIITLESLVSGKAVYATPYTTLVYQMLRLELNQPVGAESARGTDPLLEFRLALYNDEVVQRLGFGMPSQIDIFKTPPIITKDTVTVEQQQLVVYYRSAIEALAAILDEMSFAAGLDITADMLIQKLALDYLGDRAFDAADNGVPVSGININILMQNPMILDIPNTQYLVSETPSLILEERALVSTSSDIPFLIDDIVFTLTPANLNSNSGIITSSPISDTKLVVTDLPTETLPPENTATTADPVVTPSAEAVLYVDFENHPGGPYTKQNAMQDFNANESTEGIVIVDTDIVSDPSSSPSRGKVMRVTHRANRAGSEGGFRFKARFPPADEYYMAFDIFIPDNYELIAAEKMPGLMYGTLLEASHAYQAVPVPEGVKAFSVMHQLLGAEPYAGLGENKFSAYVYDADVVMRDIIFDTATPETNVTSGSNPPDAQTLWRMPKGQWVRIEQRIKQNTATATDGVGDLRDGIIQEWVNGQLMVDSRRRFRSVNTMRIDGIFMYSYYGGDPTDAINRPGQTQYEYYDNFIVSTSRITR
ncbi:MAG: hypothetical protein GXP23_03850 [Gammaproteobacteria bacterium]|nr:hypothetical protein [Gammaproteobacteria bacterium]